MVIKLEDIRELFPAISKFRAYLDTASVGLVPRTVHKALVDVLDVLASEPLIEELVDSYVSHARSEIANLINASPEEIAFTTRTTEGLKNVLRSMNVGPGDTVVAVDMDFPTVTSLVESLCRVRGCRVRVVKGKGVYTTEDLRKAIDNDVKLVVISSVQWISGWKVDLKELSNEVHNRGATIVVDGVQHVGALSLDVRAEGVDVLCVGGEKWMLNPYIGTGFMYIRRELLENLEPYPYGIRNRETPAGGWGAYWVDPNKGPWTLPPVAKNAQKFEWGGGLNLFVVALLESARTINRLGVGSIENRVLELKNYLCDRLLSEGFTIYGYAENRKHWSGITLVKTGLSYDKEIELVESLREKKVVVSRRGALGVSGVRVSTHFYNSKEDIDIFIEELKRGVKSFGQAS